MDSKSVEKDAEELRKELCALINRIPSGGVPALKGIVEQFLEYSEKLSKEIRMEAMLAYMDTLPEEDYELSPEERASLARGEEDIEAGRVHSFDSVAKELDL